MLLSLNWLKKYVNLPKGLTAKKLAHDLTLSTVEVESVEDMAEKFANIVVGKIIEVKNHPNADKLKIVDVNVGNALKERNLSAGASKGNLRAKAENLQIVCGGTNLKENMFVPVALPGSKVRWHGEGDLVELAETEIRGIKSLGMICASSEIGLQNILPCGEREITDLGIFHPLLTKEGGRGGLKPGQNLAVALGLDDIIIELDNKSITHRPDLWNHYGVARELSVIYKTSLKDVVPVNKEKEIKKLRNKETKGDGLKINIENKKLCPRYIGCVVKNVKVAPSPMWLQQALLAVGSRPINNIVDITNYVMLDVGEPMHAFDKAKLYQKQFPISNPEYSGQFPKNEKIEINIRTAKIGEKITTLDGIERKLDDSMLVIANSQKPIALAGIMGGLDTAVDEKTTEIILEAANFEAINVRKTTQKLNIRTDASNRFEKKLPVDFSLLGMQKAIVLIKEILPEAEIYPIVDANFAKQNNVKIEISHEFIESRMGQAISGKEVKDILSRLGFEIKVKSQRPKVKGKELFYLIKVPSWRATGDIDCPEDIVEEIARIYGYNNLQDQPLEVKLYQQVFQPQFELCQKIKDFLVLNSGLNEVFNYPWTSEFYLKKLGENAKMIMIANAPSEDNKWLQTSLIPNLIKNTEDNLRYLDEFGIFELSRVYNLDKSEPKMLAGVVVRDKNTDAFLEVKGIIENLFKNLKIYDLRFKIYEEKKLNKEKCLAVCIGAKEIGWLGELKKEIYGQFNFKNRNICLWEINFDELIDASLFVETPFMASKKTETRLIASLQKKYQPLPQFPAMIRDLAFELDYSVKWADMQKFILSESRSDESKDPVECAITFLSEFDLNNKKSLAFRITYQAKRTLTDKEIDLWQDKIIKLIEEKFKGRLRVNLKK